MQSKRTALEAEIQRRAREFLDQLGDGLALGYAEYRHFSALSMAFQELDELELIEPHGNDHPANALGPDTQHHAAATTSMLRSKVRRDVIVQLLIHRSRGFQPGLSCQHLEGRLRGEHTTISSAVNWLLNNGWVSDSGYKCTNRSGKPAIVWQLTPAAIEATKGGLP